MPSVTIGGVARMIFLRGRTKVLYQSEGEKKLHLLPASESKHVQTNESSPTKSWSWFVNK